MVVDQSFLAAATRGAVRAPNSPPTSDRSGRRTAADPAVRAPGSGAKDDPRGIPAAGEGQMSVLRPGPEVVADGLHRLGLFVLRGLLFRAAMAKFGFSGWSAAAVDSTYHRQY
jgi:hypothetical protein